MAGIAVGEISEISLEGDKARIDLLVRDDLDLKRGLPPESEGGIWKGGASVARRSASLIGDSFLEITPGTLGEAISAGERIQNVDEGADLEEIFKTLDGITRDIQEVTNSLANVFGGDEGQKGLEQILRDLQRILAEVAAFVTVGTDKLDGILTDGQVISANVRDISSAANASFDEILSDAKVVVRDSKAIVRNVRDVVGQSSGDVQAGLGSLSGTLVRLQSTLDSLNYSLQNVQDITDKVNEGEGTIGALVNDPSIAQKTDAILGDVREVSGPIGRLRTIMELRSEYHPLHSSFKNVVGLRLQPSPNKYYGIEFVDDFRYDSRYEIEEIVNEDGETVREQIKRTSNDTFRFTVQYALGWNFYSDMVLFGRFGIIESTGGIGTTLNIPIRRSNLLRVHGDLFDFDPEGILNPRVRLMGEYQFADYFRLIAGVDDIFNAPPQFGVDKAPLEQGFSGLSPFLSFGFIFTDEDLKGLLAITGAPAP